MSETLDYINTFARFPFALRRFLRHTLTLEEARRIVRERMEHREDNFLSMVEKNIYGYPRSPYLSLLRLAGCEFGDLAAAVKQKGLEGALRDLREDGVYVTFEEFKGRAPIVRHGHTIPVRALDFDNPFAQRDITVLTGGSSGAAVSVGTDLDYIAGRAPDYLITLSAQGLLDAPVVRWNGILPIGTLRNVLRDVYIGRTNLHWFSPNGLRDSKYWLKYAAATYYILLCLRLRGVRVPFPEYVKPDHALIVARCVAETVKAYGRCLLQTNVSRAVRVCLAALETGLDLRGAVISGGSEPTTLAKVQQIERAGVVYFPHYGMIEASRIGSGCANRADVSDVHLLKDAFALFTYPYRVDGAGVTVPAFNLTTLLSTAPKLMLNVQIDDYGILEERACGCELESYGYTTHLREMHSYSKLTGEGVTLIGNEMLRILEEVLPARFGGSSLDYQLAEREDASGFTRLYLAISPRVHIVDDQQVIEALLNALSDSSPMGDAARILWQSARTLQVERREPVLTSGGKLLPLHIPSRLKQPNNSNSGRNQ